MKNTFLLTLFFLPFVIKAQTSIEYLDINNVKAGVLNKGDMFMVGWHPKYEFPKGSGINATSNGSVWIYGFDSVNHLIVSHPSFGFDNNYLPGPIDTPGVFSSNNKNTWNKIWKVNKSDIENFKQLSSHHLGNTEINILTWPASGNYYARGYNGMKLNIADTSNYAPFVDINNDGIYNALDGDYPDILGEQALWWIFNDNVSVINSNHKGLQFEFHCMAYACNVPLLENVLFFKIRIVNRSNQKYYNCRIAYSSLADLGNFEDDFIGFDSATCTAIIYNGDVDDEQYYGLQLTQHGVTFLNQPLENNLSPNTIGSFINYSFDWNHNFNSFPDNDIDYYNYMNAKWLNNTHLKNGCNGYSDSALKNYAFYSDPNLAGGVSEVWCNDLPGDRNYVMSTSNFDFSPNTSQVFSFATFNTPLGSDNSNFKTITDLAKIIHQFKNGCDNAPDNIKMDLSNSKLQIFPNPSNTEITINSTEPITTISIVSMDGQVVYQTKVIDKPIQHAINTTSFPNGNYIVHVQSVNNIFTKKIIIAH